MADEVTHLIPPELDGARVDKAVAELLGVSRATARQLVAQGVTIDGEPVKPADRVSPGSSITSPVPEDDDELIPEPVDFGVLYEDDDLVVVDKPSGLVVHPGSGRRTGTLAAGLLYRYPELVGVGEPGRWGLVHRLDKDTSGALIVGRNAGSFEALTAMLRRREITRIYTALVQGTFRSPTGTIDAPVGRDPARPTRRAAVADGKPAFTHYEVVESFPDRDCSLLEVRLDTGRTHQIRVHMAAIDRPVIGDSIYGKPSTQVIAPRLFLHAARLVFRQPRSGTTLDIECPLPPDLQNILDGLGGDGSE